MPQIDVPRRYRAPTGGRATIPVQGDTVRACIESAEAEYPGFGELVLDRNGELRSFVSLFINGDELERSALDRRVRDDDTISVLAAAAGG
jgi:molybdopterin synthase sulfur carrier subunit